MAKPTDHGVNKTVKRSAIIFPEEDTRFVLDKPPACAEGATFCEHFEDYPEEHLKNVLSQNQISKDLFGVDAIPDLDTRDDGDYFLCKSKLATIFPKVAKNAKNAWKIIINQEDDDRYIQGVVVEKCLVPRSKCDLITENIRNNYITTCKQKYIYRRLLSLNDAGQPVPDSFLLPSACCCSYKRNFNFFGRWNP